MFIALAVILALAWILGFAIFHVASVAIHVLVLAAIVSVVVHFLRRGKGNDLTRSSRSACRHRPRDRATSWTASECSGRRLVPVSSLTREPLSRPANFRSPLVDSATARQPVRPSREWLVRRGLRDRFGEARNAAKMPRAVTRAIAGAADARHSWAGGVIGKEEERTHQLLAVTCSTI